MSLVISMYLPAHQISKKAAPERANLLHFESLRSRLFVYNFGSYIMNFSIHDSAFGAKRQQVKDDFVTGSGRSMRKDSLYLTDLDERLL